MELEQGVQKKSACKPLLIGVLLWILISFLISVLNGCTLAPQCRSVEVDLYSGNSIVHEHSLWKHTHTESPKLPHVQWAIDHMEPGKSWYCVTASSSKGFLGRGGFHADATTKSYVYEIYSLNIPEDEKVKLLHQYHRDLDVIKTKLEEYKSLLSMKDFNARWNQKISTLNDESSEASPMP